MELEQQVAGVDHFVAATASGLRARLVTLQAAIQVRLRCFRPAAVHGVASFQHAYSCAWGRGLG